MQKLRPFVLVALACIAFRAHDYWLIADRLVVPTDQAIAYSLFVGEDFLADEEKHFEPGRVTRLDHVHAGGTDDVRQEAPSPPRWWLLVGRIGYGDDDADGVGARGARS